MLNNKVEMENCQKTVSFPFRQLKMKH